MGAFSATFGLRSVQVLKNPNPFTLGEFFVSLGENAQVIPTRSGISSRIVPIMTRAKQAVRRFVTGGKTPRLLQEDKIDTLDRLYNSLERPQNALEAEQKSKDPNIAGIYLWSIKSLNSMGFLDIGETFNRTLFNRLREHMNAWYRGGIKNVKSYQPESTNWKALADVFKEISSLVEFDLEQYFKEQMQEGYDFGGQSISEFVQTDIIYYVKKGIVTDKYIKFLETECLDCFVRYALIGILFSWANVRPVAGPKTVPVFTRNFITDPAIALNKRQFRQGRCSCPARIIKQAFKTPVSDIQKITTLSALNAHSVEFQLYHLSELFNVP